MAAEAPNNPTKPDISWLKYQYWQAVHRKYDTTISDDIRGDEKRHKILEQARERENKAFVKRLRERLRDLGVSKAGLEQLEQPQLSAVAGLAPTADRLLSKPNTAILVIHGIGEQNPYETLDQFGRNLMRYLAFDGGIDDLQISADRYDHNDSTEARIRLQTNKFGPRDTDSPDKPRPAIIDIYEYYWAPETEDKISYKETLLWLIKTTLTPIRMLAANFITLKDESDETLSPWAIFRRELLRIMFIYLPLLFVLAGLIYLLPKAMQLPGALKTIFESSTRIAMTICFAASVIIDYVVLRQLWSNLLRYLRRQPAIFKSQWVWWTLLVSAAFALLGYVIGHFNKFNRVEPREYFSPLLHWNVLWVLVTAGVARLMQLFLKNFIGDVAVYTNADAKAKNFAARKAILAGAVKATTRLLRDTDVLQDQGINNQAYDQVIIAGHSLGSVIAYDTLNQLFNKQASRSDQIVGYVPTQTQITQPDLDKIRGLVTFGSPLDKVYYFFRENVPQQQAIRAQVLQFLQSFKKRPSGADYGLYRFQRYNDIYKYPGLRRIQWLNAWSKQDPVSGALHFYTGLSRREFTYAIPIYAHLSYWEDLRFYEFFAEPLLLGNQTALLQKAMGASV